MGGFKMGYTRQGLFVNSWKAEEEKLSNGQGAVVDHTGKQTTAYIVEKRYKVQDYFWNVFWGNGDNKMKSTYTLGQKLIYDLKMSVDDLRVLFAILDMMSIGNLFEYRQRVIADALKISEPRVSKSIKRLIEYNVLYPLKEYGKIGFYVNASVSYRGEIKAGAKLMKMDIKDQADMALKMAKGIYTGQKKEQ